MTPLTFAQTEQSSEYEDLEESEEDEEDSQPQVAYSIMNGDLSGNDVDEEEEVVASSGEVRKFHDVLDELLAEFSYDVKKGQLSKLKNLSIRRIRVSEAIPSSYENYLELLLAERIREYSRVKLISCIPCKTRSSRMIEGKLVITSPSTNMAEMQRAADQLEIDNFVDVLLVYHSTHMVLALQAFNTSSKEMVWARTYNSETVKSRYQKMAVDYSQVEKSRPGEDYVPDYRYLVGFGAATVPNVNRETKDASFFSFQLRGSERFDNRKHEFGMLYSLFVRTNTIIEDHPIEDGFVGTTTAEPTTTTNPIPEPFATGHAIYATYTRNFLGAIESYSSIRHGMTVGIGGFMATGYLTSTARLGWDIYFGRRFQTSLGAIYLSKATINLAAEDVTVESGTGGDFVFQLNF